MTDRAATDEPDEERNGEQPLPEQPVAAEPAPELRDEAQELAVEEPAPEPDAATEAAAPDLRGTSEVPDDVPEVGEVPEPEPPIDAETIDSAEPVAAPPTGPGPEDTPFPAPEPDAETDSGPGVEILVGAAFAGGLALALLLRRLRS